MENNKAVPQNKEKTWQEGVNQHLHKLTVRLRIIYLSVLAVFVFAGTWIYICHDLDAVWGELSTLALIVLPASLALIGGIVGDSLENCYRQYRCKTCGHIHRPGLEELDQSNGLLHCEKCGKITRHKTLPMKK